MNMKSRPRISIVTPAYNEEKYIKACIESCLAQRVLPYEILVIDNKSTDRTADVVRQIIAQHEHGSLVCLLQQNEAQGLIPTRNFGFRQARGDVLGRIDADSFLQENWVENVQEIFMEKTVDAATGPVTYHDMPAKKFGKISDDFIRRRLAKFAREYAFLFGSNMAIRASTCMKLPLRPVVMSLTKYTKTLISRFIFLQLIKKSSTQAQWLAVCQRVGSRIRRANFTITSCATNGRMRRTTLRRGQRACRL